MNKYVEQAIEHYQDNLDKLNRIASDCIDMLTFDMDTSGLEQYLKRHHIYVEANYCPLCNQYLCPYCPVGRLGHMHCDDTPWYHLAHLYYDLTCIRSHCSAVLYISKLRKAFEAELAFLKEVGNDCAD